MRRSNSMGSGPTLYV